MISPITKVHECNGLIFQRSANTQVIKNSKYLRNFVPDDEAFDCYY